MLDETIIAISTPPGYGGLGIVRLSGRKALPIAKKIFRLRRKTWREVEPRAFVLGDIYDDEKKGWIDEAFLAYFPAPRSYTREDVVEISCHGSPVVLEEVVRLEPRLGPGSRIPVSSRSGPIFAGGSISSRLKRSMT